MKYMLDTNICIYLIKKHPENVLKKLTILDVGDVCISAITLAELLYGVQKSHQQQKNKAALEEFTSPLEIIPFGEEAAAHYGHIRAYLEKKGMPIGSLDMMIAAHAQCLGSILVTNNKKEFFRVPNLKIEDWVHL
ncbi:MAG TPA: type II toxin-antitoxin system VapC family toxin [Gammaproteobacteria bacterium]|nr:type II toxin-antitoxin system VapC family toxin [Gammaproteobacteria bacterium]